MRWLADSGILLRMISPGDPQHASIRDAIDTLAARGDEICCATQNVAEFWNVSTRVALARDGFGLSIDETRRRLDAIEREVVVLREPSGAYEEWKRLVLAHKVSGVQVHDARLVAMMKVYGIIDLLTLNGRDFRRYPNIRVHTPADVVATNEPEK